MVDMITDYYYCHISAPIYPIDIGLVGVRLLSSLTQIVLLRSLSLSSNDEFKNNNECSSVRGVGIWKGEGFILASLRTLVGYHGVAKLRYGHLILPGITNNPL